ncbi:hypothetical protein ACP3W2_24255, partial [Salmonella enterica]|uniref:hypothetical protein n=1 Tax=Salmonella enterica TaxID=28901 RepID=UPI003CE8A4CE
MFFTGSSCNVALYTRNTDKAFFGICVMPIIKDNDIYDIILSDPFAYDTDHQDKSKITKYYLELDSKLFDPVLNLSNREILAL